jgi:hypothetical protein
MLWARYNAHRPRGEVGKIPVSLTFENIPDRQWDLVFGPGHLRCQRDLARDVEFYLKRRIWVAENVPDDHVVWPALPVPAVYTPQHHQWGVELAWVHTADELGSTAIVAPFAGENAIDLSRLRRPRTAVEEAATADRLAQVAALTGGRLAVYPVYETLGEGPFEFVVQLRGMEQIFYDVYDRPAQIHALMEFVTQAILADHERRQERGWINCPSEPTGCYQMVPTFRQIATYLPPDFAERPPRLSDERAYVHAQSAFGLGPAMYEEFVHPYNSRIAALFAPKTVYYHGCENLDQKLDVIATLPNLGRHHVSPWSSVALAAETYQGAVNLEVITHPNLIARGFPKERMKAEMQRLVEAAEGHPMDLSITDIHSLGDNPDSLRIWAEAAQEVVQQRGGP